MELKTHALERVLEALSPAIAAELDRVVQETRESLEQEFQTRLQTVVRETETAIRATDAIQLDRAVEEATNVARNEATEACAAQIDRAVSEAKDEIRKQVMEEAEQRFQERLVDATTRQSNEAAGDRAKLQEQLDQWRVFAETQQQLAEASSQSEILARFLKIAQPFAGGLAVYVTKPDGFALWKSRGKGAFPEIISKETTDPESYFKVITVRGKAVAAVCALPSFKVDALDFLVSSLERAVEVFGMKLRAPVPKPVLSETTVAVSSMSATTSVPTAAANLGLDEQKAHAEARRAARLLISEIKLYNETEVENGRQNSDIYHRLRREIDLGRESYSQRVPKAVLEAHDYFHEELVRILGENDPSRLGTAYPGPKRS